MSALVEEVIVTARKREESLQDAPLSVSAFSGESLEARGFTNIAEVGSITPNLTYQSNPGAGGSSSVATVYIRGVGQRDFLGTIDNGVGFYIDDVYIARTVGATVDLLDVERIEVLRGPQGTLFGRNNVGGAIALYTKKPTDTFGGYIAGTVGTDNQQKIRGSVNVPVTDTLWSNFSAMWSEQDGYVDRPAGGDLGDNDVTAVRTNVLWLASDTLEITFSADYSTEDENGPAFQLVDVDEVGQWGNGFPGFYNNVTAGATCGYAEWGPFRPHPDCYNDQWVNDDNLGTAPTYSETDVWGTKLGVEWEISDTLTFKSITAYRDLDSKFARDADASPITIVHFYDKFTSEQFTQEFQLLGTAFNDKVDWITGLYYFDEDGYNQNVLDFAIANFDSKNDFTSTSAAAFAQGTYHATDKLHLTLGLRYTDEEKKFDPDQRVISSNIGIPPDTLILPLGENKIDAQETTPMVNIAYDVRDSLMVYGTYSEGFRSGGFVQRIFPPRPDVVDFDTETVYSYELGFKYTNEDGTLSLNGAVFYMDYDDIQVRVPAGVAQVEQNVGEAEISGAELELKWQLGATWFIEAGVGYTDAEYTDIDIDVSSIPTNPDGSLTVDLDDPFAVIQEGNEFDHVPEWSANASVSKEFDLDNAGFLLVRFSGSYHSSYFNEPLNLPQVKTPSEDIWDIAAIWTSPTERYSVNAGVKNLTDEEYRTTGYFNPTIGTIENIFDRGRQWYVTGRYNY
jgi:iron complex outermembrane receptor protein